MKLFLLWQDVNNDYDTYDSCLVAANDAEDARTIQPSESAAMWDSWADAEHIQCRCIGEAAEWIKRGVIIASFNAG